MVPNFDNLVIATVAFAILRIDTQLPTVLISNESASFYLGRDVELVHF